MNSDTKLIIGAILTSAALIIGAMIVFRNDTSPKRADQGAASMIIDKKTEDVGTMEVKDERTATFTITNTSDAILRVWNISTSCDCTFASLTIGETKTGEFNMPMHMKSDLKNWIGEVPAQETAVLAVTYRPNIMPVTGPVTRQVRFSTNDPKNTDVEVSISANVL